MHGIKNFHTILQIPVIYNECQRTLEKISKDKERTRIGGSSTPMKFFVVATVLVLSFIAVANAGYWFYAHSGNSGK
ncbi:hypothetical protein NECAME_05319 [Necator americanus]|uniref:Uncharacterized protein n=1 Tax=Necator americanus TaxID=51031 RepID=W2SHT1_NECAM|nr:hypothetical protein NECAME_05319 [Necator americanus]ETN69214.1 hypothetical protein NECAME_05319 [Necator americanus]